MSRVRSSIRIVAGIVMAFLIAAAAVALASGEVFYEAGKRSKPPYVFLTVQRSVVTKVRWAIRVRCEGARPSFDSEVTKLNAPINNGHFSKTAHQTIGRSALGTSTATTTVKGTISRNHATVKLSVEEDIVSFGTCTGSHSFTATKTARFH
jgi:hypothetical protein